MNQTTQEIDTHFQSIKISTAFLIAAHFLIIQQHLVNIIWMTTFALFSPKKISKLSLNNLLLKITHLLNVNANGRLNKYFNCYLL